MPDTTHTSFSYIHANPVQRAALALSYTDGPKVDDWVADQVFGDASNTPRHTDTDEALWQDFITEFQRAFAEAVSESL